MAPAGGDDLGPRLLRYLRAELHRPQVALAEPLAPLPGGFDTTVLTFRLDGAGPDLSGPLVLRVLGPHHDPLRARRERTIQNAVAGLGFPAPRVPLACVDPAVLGGAFLVMERRPGRPLLLARRLGIASTLAETQARLHGLDPDVVLRALDHEVPGSGALVTLDGHLEQLAARIARPALGGLAPALGWLREHRSSAGGNRAICHGDFHPQNILWEGREVTAVLDWPNTLIADPAYDVAATRVILGLTPLEILPADGPPRWARAVLRRVLLAAYLRGYRRRRPLDPRPLAYHEALACMRGLVRVAESRALDTDRAGPTPANPLDASTFGERLAARFARLTGLRPALPPRGTPPDHG